MCMYTINCCLVLVTSASYIVGQQAYLASVDIADTNLTPHKPQFAQVTVE